MISDPAGDATPLLFPLDTQGAGGYTVACCRFGSRRAGDICLPKPG